MQTGHDMWDLINAPGKWDIDEDEMAQVNCAHKNVDEMTGTGRQSGTEAYPTIEILDVCMDCGATRHAGFDSLL